MPRWAVCLALASCLPFGAAHALDYRSVSQAAPLLDGPSAKAKPLYVISAGTPVEQVVVIDGWSKVRDAKGDLSWIEKKYLSDKRTVIVRVDRAQVLSKSEDKAALAFEADRDVVLDLVEVLPDGWLKVTHRDGQGGYIRATQVWGR